MPSTLHVESHEKRSAIAARLVDQGYAVKIRTLAVGDYALPGKFVIERKEANDFASSIMSGHLFG